MTNLIFFGADQYSAVTLAAILESGVYHLVSIVTDKHADQSPVEKLALRHNIPVSYYPDFDHSLITRDTLGLCASFDHLIPVNIIELFTGNLYNLHPSLLPQYRNVSPVQYAIAMGDKETGITLFRISPTIDDGEIIAQVSEPILPGDTTATLTPRLFKKGAELFVRFLGSDLNGSAQPAVSTAGRSDPAGPLIFTKRLTRDSGYLEWPILHKLLQNEPINPSETKNELLKLQKTPSLDHLARALTPWPTVWSLVPSRKGELRITLESVTPEIKLKIAGKPKPISLSDFTKYYL